MGWRATVFSLLAALVLSIFCMMGMDTVVRQIQLIVPHPSPPQEQRAYEEAQRAWRADRPLYNTIAEFNLLKQRNPSEEELAAWAAADRNSAMPLLGGLLVRLRESKVSASTQPASSRPSLDDRLPSLLADVQYAPPVRLGAAGIRDVFVNTMQARGISARRAAALTSTVRWNRPFSDHRAVIRELSDRLLALGRQYVQMGRPADAALAYQAVVRMLTDIVRDSPLPDVALLSAEQLPTALRELDKVRGGSQGEEAARAIETFRTRWVNTSDRDLSMMPQMSVPAPAADSQSRVLHSLAASVSLLATGWLLALVCLVLIFVILVTRAFGPIPMVWRWNGWGATIAPAIVAVPAIGACLVLASGLMPFIWLSSMRSLGAAVFLPAVTLLTWYVAGLLSARPAETKSQVAPRSLAIAIGVGVVVAATLVTAVLSHHAEPWRPPPAIQLFRRAGAVAGMTSLAVLAVLLVMTFRIRRRSNLPAGAWPRVLLAVASPAMAVILLSAAVSLSVNSGRDREHEAAFAKAAEDPLADRLGQDWFDAYFGPAASLLNTATPTASSNAAS